MASWKFIKLKKYISNKNYENVIIFLPSCLSNPELFYYICGTQKEKFCIKVLFIICFDMMNFWVSLVGEVAKLVFANVSSAENDHHILVIDIWYFVIRDGSKRRSAWRFHNETSLIKRGNGRFDLLVGHQHNVLHILLTKLIRQGTWGWIPIYKFRLAQIKILNLK